MLMLPDLKVFLATKPTDMRKSYDGLAAIVKQELNRDVFTGDLFVFFNRRYNIVLGSKWLLSLDEAARKWVV